MVHILISFLFFNLIFYIFYIHYRRGQQYINKKNLFIYTLLLIAFGTYGGGEGDYLKLKEVVDLYHSLFDVYYYNGLEEQYRYLAYFLNGNYFLWRFVLYSIQFIGFSWFLYKAKLNTYPIFLCFVSLCLVNSVYGRAYWGIIYFFMGLYLFFEKKNILFLIPVLLCYVSHTQNVALLVLLPLAFFPLRKWHLIVFVLLFGTLASLLNDTFTTLLSLGGVEDADYINGKMKTYSESELGTFGNSMGEYIVSLLRYVPNALFFYSLLSFVFFKRKLYVSLSKSWRSIINITIGIVFLSLVVLGASLGGGTFFYRILDIVFFPISILLLYMKNIGVLSRISFNRYIYIFLLGTEFRYFLDLYYAYSNGIF